MSRKVHDPNPGRRLAELRNKSGYSQEELGDLIGVTGEQIANYEHARTVIGADRILQIAQALGCRAANLLAPAGALPPARRAQRRRIAAITVAGTSFAIPRAILLKLTSIQGI